MKYEKFIVPDEEESKKIVNNNESESEQTQEPEPEPEAEVANLLQRVLQQTQANNPERPEQRPSISHDENLHPVKDPKKPDGTPPVWEGPAKWDGPAKPSGTL